MRIAAFFMGGLLTVSCGIGPRYEPALTVEDSGLNESGKNVVVTNFYKAKSELTYLGDLNLSITMESAKLRDISFDVARHLAGVGIESTAVKNAKADSLKKGEVMLSGAILTRSIPMEENFPFPGMMIVLLIGNILPSPVAYVSGVDMVYRYELVDASGKILFSSPEKKSRISYEDYWVWGRIFNAKGYEEEISSKLDGQIFELIVEDLFR